MQNKLSYFIAFFLCMLSFYFSCSSNSTDTETIAAITEEGTEENIINSWDGTNDWSQSTWNIE
jgi:hypothetical protein